MPRFRRQGAVPYDRKNILLGDRETLVTNEEYDLMVQEYNRMVLETQQEIDQELYRRRKQRTEAGRGVARGAFTGFFEGTLDVLLRRVNGEASNPKRRRTFQNKEY